MGPPGHVRSATQDVRFWKDRLLYQIRRFREIVGRRLDQGMKALDEVPDMVERERLRRKFDSLSLGDLKGMVFID